MQPSTLNKPVMDVAAPRGPVQPPAQNSPAAPIAVAPTPAPAPQPTNLPVQSAPASAPQPSAPQMPQAAEESRPAPSKKPAGQPEVHRAPVALITVTVFVMIVLSALAVTVYVTSQTA